MNLDNVVSQLWTIEAPSKNRTHYKIPQGTQVWLVIGAADCPMITEKEVVYTEKDVRGSNFTEYHFTLPPNNRLAEWLIVRKDDVY